MVTQATKLETVAENPQTRMASYFGLQVEVVERMNDYSLIRYRSRQRVVTTEDLSGEDSSLGLANHLCRERLLTLAVSGA